MLKKYGFKQIADILGMFRFDGALVCGLHPSKISVSDSSIDFTYTVGNETVVRSYGLTRSDGKITSVLFPDGHSLEVLRNG